MLPRPRRSRRRAAWKRGTVPAINRGTRGPLMETALEHLRARRPRTVTVPLHMSTTAAVPLTASVIVHKPLEC
jgi:hypothetical protein